MQEYKVKIIPAAQHDALSIAGHLSALEPDEAAKYYEQLIQSVSVLKTLPQGCPPARDSQLRFRGYRTLTVNDFVLFFVISGNNVEIRRIINSKRMY